MEPSPLEKKPAAPPPPLIYKLIEQRADSQAIMQQLYVDFYSPNPDPERVFLAIDELQRRGHGGKSVLDYLATTTDELNNQIKKIQESETHDIELQELLGIKRIRNI